MPPVAVLKVNTDRPVAGGAGGCDAVARNDRGWFVATLAGPLGEVSCRTS